MEHEAFVCPVCGAPYREVIPAGVVHVKCSYCGGIIVVPSSAPRCPNHPDTIADGFCNDCGQSYCRDCLSIYVVEGEDDRGVLRLCSSCLKQRYLKKDEYLIPLGALFLIFGFFFLLFEPIFGILWIALFAVPVLAYGIYRTRQAYGKAEVALERKPQKSSHEIYQGMLTEYTKSFGASSGSVLLENRLGSYMRDGLSREEAVRKLAEDEGYT